MFPYAVRMAEKAYKKYHTRDPEEFIVRRNIKLKVFERPAGLLGCFTVCNRKPTIGINQAAEGSDRKSGLAHEVGHCINDYQAAASGFEFRDTKFYSMSNAPCEKNATLTGAELFITDDEILSRIYYEDYLRLMDHVRSNVDHYRSDQAKLLFQQEQLQEFYDIHSDIPSYESLARDIGMDVGFIKVKCEILRYKNFEIPEIPETRTDFLKFWQRKKP